MRELYVLLGISTIKMLAYHPQTDGMVERQRHPQKRPQKIHRQIPQQLEEIHPILATCIQSCISQCTGFSPFELIFGRQPRGPMDVLRKEWEEPQNIPDSTISYLPPEHLREAEGGQRSSNKDRRPSQKKRDNVVRPEGQKQSFYGWRLRIGTPTIVIQPSSCKVGWPILGRKSSLNNHIPYPYTHYQKRNRTFHVNMLA